MKIRILVLKENPRYIWEGISKDIDRADDGILTHSSNSLESLLSSCRVFVSCPSSSGFSLCTSLSSTSACYRTEKKNLYWSKIWTVTWEHRHSCFRHISRDSLQTVPLSFKIHISEVKSDKRFPQTEQLPCVGSFEWVVTIAQGLGQASASRTI